MAVERAAQDRPLGRVGVLELIDENHSVGVPQTLTRLLAGDGVGQGVRESQRPGRRRSPGDDPGADAAPPPAPLCANATRVA